MVHAPRISTVARWTVLLITASFAATLAAADAAVDARRAQVADAIHASLKKHGVPGASIAVVNGCRIDWTAGFGTAEIGSSRTVTPDTLFQAASISKPVTALAVLRAVELRQLKLDEDVNSRLISWHIPPSPLSVGRPVTLRLLLSHSAGFNVHGFAGYARGMPVPTLVQVLAGAPPANSEPVKLLIKPGYKYMYSGGGYSIVQQLLADVTGTPFPDFMRRQVLDPLGMNRSTYEQPLPESLAAGAASGHRADGKAIDGRWHTYPEMAAAGLWTTPSDLAQVVIDVAGTMVGGKAKLLSPGIVAEMLKPQTGQYGLGFSLRGDGTSLEFSHGGANEGFRCVLAGIPSTGQGVVIMTNSDAGGNLLGEVVPVVSQAYGWPKQK
jgi:CubicO group peptidase (beta-lactamase class C family)